MVVDQINSTGGVNGHPVQTEFVDPRADATQSIQLATQLVQQDNVDLLVGGGFSPECLAVQDLAQKLQVVYVPADACATDTFSTQTCNRFTFRPYTVGYQYTDPVAQWEVTNIGKNWGIIYPDYALGQSNLQTNKTSLDKAGGTLSVQIAVPLGEANVTPYVSRIPTDGSIQGLIVSETGTDLARTVSVMQQFGITQKMPIVTAIGKESFSGVYPDALGGSIITGARPSEGLPDNQWDADFLKQWKATAHKDADVSGPLGGVDNATPGVGNGYNVIVAMEALKNAMRTANFTGRADTDKLIAAMENLNLPQGADLPDGPLVMNPADHQGRSNVYLMKINGQHEDVIQTFPPDQLAASTSCRVA
jgi:ABC-type branched-subunit amino acid transport system substrate-binding protein